MHSYAISGLFFLSNMNTSQSNEIILEENIEKLIFQKQETVWALPDGRYHMSKDTLLFGSYTHKRCKCGAIIERHRGKCDACYEEFAKEKYYKLEIADWDGTIVYEETYDKYFYDIDDLADFIETEKEDGNEVDIQDLRIVLCEPNYLAQIDYSYWDECLPEDGVLPEELIKKVDEFNIWLSTQSPISWSPSNKRVIITEEDFQ